MLLWVHSWLLIACGDLKRGLSCTVPAMQLQAGSLWASYWNYVLLGDHDPSADAYNSTQRVCFEIPPAHQSSTDDNYLYVSLCLASMNDPMSSYFQYSLLHSS